MASEENVVAGEQYNTPVITCSVGTFVYWRLLEYDQENIALTNEVTNKSLTLRELLKRSCQLADAIQNFGITKNDIAAISSENNIHYYIPVMGCIFSAVPITLINPMYTNDELCHSMGIAEPSVMFCSSTTVPNVINLKQRFPCIKAIIVIDGEAPPGATTLSDFIHKYSKIEAISSFTPEEVDLDHTALIMSSSGTTGLPKGVMITHKNVNSKNMMLFDPNYINKFQIKVALGVLPFFHAFGFYSVLTGLLLGKRIIVLPVAPAELEKILMGHPKIKDAAVVGLPDERDGEKPMAFVVKEDDVKLSAAEVFNYVRRVVSKNKYLHGGVVFINDIPRSSTGKILRAKVKQMARGLKSKL